MSDPEWPQARTVKLASALVSEANEARANLVKAATSLPVIHEDHANPQALGYTGALLGEPSWQKLDEAVSSYKRAIARLELAVSLDRAAHSEGRRP